MQPKILLSANTNRKYYIDAVNLCGEIADAQIDPNSPPIMTDLFYAMATILALHIIQKI